MKLLPTPSWSEFAEGGSALGAGIAFAAREIDAVPAEPHDGRLDAVPAGRGLLTCGA